MNMQEFIEAVKLANIRDRVLMVRGYEITEQVFINLYNLPVSINKLNRGGAEAENNRIMLVVEFQGLKCKLKMSCNALGREYHLRGKTASPERVAKYVITYLEKIVAEVEPRLTHEPRK